MPDVNLGVIRGRGWRPVLPPSTLIMACLLALPVMATPLGLAQALREGGARSAAADSARFSANAAQQDTAAAKALFLPEVSLSGGFRALDERPGLLSQPMSLGPLTLPSLVFPTEDKQSWRYKAIVQYLLWDFGKRSKAVAATMARTQAVQATGMDQIRRTQAEIASRYVALLDLKAQRQVVAQRRQALTAHLASSHALYENGMVSRNDCLRTELTLRQVEDADLGLDRAYASGLEALNQAMGLAPASPQELPGTLPAPPPWPWDASTCKRKAMEANEGVHALRARVIASRNVLTMHKLDYCPNLVIEADHTYVQDTFLTHPHESQVGLRLSWKIFDGARTARIHRSESETGQSERDLLEATRKLENEASATLRAFQQSLRELQTAETNERSAEENFRIVLDQYQEGLVKNADVLDAEAVLAESRSSRYGRRYRAYTQQAQLLAVLGEDLPTFYDHLDHLDRLETREQ